MVRNRLIVMEQDQHRRTVIGFGDYARNPRSIEFLYKRNGFSSIVTKLQKMVFAIYNALY